MAFDPETGRIGLSGRVRACLRRSKPACVRRTGRGRYERFGTASAGAMFEQMSARRRPRQCGAHDASAALGSMKTWGSVSKRCRDLGDLGHPRCTHGRFSCTQQLNKADRALSPRARESVRTRTHWEMKPWVSDVVQRAFRGLAGTSGRLGLDRSFIRRTTGQ